SPTKICKKIQFIESAANKVRAEAAAKNTESMNVTSRRFLLLTAFVLFMLCLGAESHAQNPQSAAGNGKVCKVVLDPGHGGKDPGCVYKNYYEKDVTLGIAKRLGELIRKNYPDVEVIYTRTTDKYVELVERGKIANRANADLFISI